MLTQSPTEVRVDFPTRRTDYIRWSRPLSGQWMMIFNLAFFTYGMIWWGLHNIAGVHSPQLLPIFFMSVAFWAATYYLQFIVEIVRRFPQNNTVRDTGVTINRSGLTVIEENDLYFIPWDEVKEIQQKSNVILMHSKTRRSRFIVPTGFASQDQMMAFLHTMQALRAGQDGSPLIAPAASENVWPPAPEQMGRK